MVQPEGHPGDADRHEGGDVDGEHVVGQLPLELHVHGQAGVHPGGCLHVTLKHYYYHSHDGLIQWKIKP